MKLAAHPYGRYYFHIPTGKVVLLTNKFETYYEAHFQYRETLRVTEDELRPAYSDEIAKYYNYKVPNL